MRILMLYIFSARFFFVLAIFGVLPPTLWPSHTSGSLWSAFTIYIIPLYSIFVSFRAREPREKKFPFAPGDCGRARRQRKLFMTINNFYHLTCFPRLFPWNICLSSLVVWRKGRNPRQKWPAKEIIGGWREPRKSHLIIPLRDGGCLCARTYRNAK